MQLEDDEQQQQQQQQQDLRQPQQPEFSPDTLADPQHAQHDLKHVQDAKQLQPQQHDCG